MKRKKPLQEVMYVLGLVAAIVVLFFWYTTQNSSRMEERNKNYAADSARQTATQINEEFNNAVAMINAYSYFVGKSLSTPSVTPQMLAEMEANSQFDALIFTDMTGLDHASDGRTADVTNRVFYQNGIQGKSGISIIFDPYLYNETMAAFYAPVYYKGEVIGVLRGAYLAEEYLRKMLFATYFGEQASVFLCTPDGRVIASSDSRDYDQHLIDALLQAGVIDQAAAANAKGIFSNGGAGAFICNSDSKTDNICVRYLSDNEFVLVQIFPKNVTQSMIRDENLVGIQLEVMLIGLFIIYIFALLIRRNHEQKQLKQNNLEMGYIINGVNTLFSRYAMIDFETDTYQYLVGTQPESSSLAPKGSYQELSGYLCSMMIDEQTREEFAAFLDKASIIRLLAENKDLRFECHVMQNGQEAWMHVNLICLERKDGRASKILFIRQNITEIKKRELQIQSELSLAARKERQYRIAITSNSFCTFEFNLTQDRIDHDITRTADSREISLLERAGLSAPCKASECFENWKAFILPESLDEYSASVNIAYLKKRFDEGDAQVDVDYWGHGIYGEPICVRQSFIMTRDYDTDDILVMAVAKEITDSVRKQKEQTQALQEALMQAQHANKAKTTFLSNMSHDIRTPMNAIIGFTTIAVSHIDNKEQVKDCLQKVLSSSNHLLSLINDILDMSRIESGKVQIKEQECNISEIMHNLVDIIQPQIKAKQLELFIDTYEVVNEDVIADALKMNQVFINLMSNAVKYTPAGGTVSFCIMQKASFRHGYGDYVFIVKDNGIGMSKDFVQHIFEPFERESTVTQSGIQGTGLGMAITRNIVEMMNGTITVESEAGKGSIFTVELSLKLQDITKDAEQLKELEGLRALVVDDDLNVCDSVNKMLKKLGMRPEWTTSGREAAYRAKMAQDEGDSYHTYIIDWQMPELSGIETTRKIRSMVDDNAPIIILTAYDWTDIEEEAKAAGVTAFCAKPLFMSDLKSALLAANNLAGKGEEAAAWTLADFSGKRILLVEDIELNREIAEFILTESGFLVESAPDGTDAVTMMEQSEEYYYDAVLMDIQMPIMNGYEATRTIRNMAREDVKTLPIIAMTANALEEDKEAALKNGMNAHIAKPLDMDIFIEVLKQFIH